MGMGTIRVLLLCNGAERTHPSQVTKTQFFRLKSTCSLPACSKWCVRGGGGVFRFFALLSRGCIMHHAHHAFCLMHDARMHHAFSIGYSTLCVMEDVSRVMHAAMSLHQA